MLIDVVTLGDIPLYNEDLDHVPGRQPLRN
jgi:hypothetical protein